MDEMVADVVDEVVDTGSSEGTEPEGGAEPAAQPEDPYSSKAARAFSQWLKGHRDTDPNGATHFRTAKDAFSEAYALRQIEKNGLNGVREKYALLDSVIHNDPERGELKGAEAIAALQDSVRSYAEMDEQIAAGDPRALDSLGEEFNGGLAKLAPAILDRIAASNEQAYEAATLPHFVKMLAKSDLVRDYNGMVDVLEEKPPAWLTADQKTAWAADQQRRVIALAAKMGGWLNAQWDKSKNLPQPGTPQNGAGIKGDPLSEREAAFNEKEQVAHWTTKIIPERDKYMDTTFAELFRPYEKRLNLDRTIRDGLKKEFGTRVIAKASENKAYADQIKRFRAQRNPDPQTVMNYGKVEFNKHAKTVMDALVNERYKPFLNGKPRGAQPGNTNGAGSRAAPSKGIQFVATRPAEDQILHKSRTLDQIHKKIFPLKNGTTVQLRTQ